MPHPKYVRAKRRKQLRKLAVAILLVVACLSLLVLSLWLLNPAGHPSQTSPEPVTEDAPVNFK